MLESARGSHQPHLQPLKEKEGLRKKKVKTRIWPQIDEKTPESSLDTSNQSTLNKPWILIENTDAEDEASILWPPDANSQLIGKDPDAGKDWKQEKEMTEDEMVGCHHQHNGHELGQTPGYGEGQGSLAWCSPRGRVEYDTTWQLNNEQVRCLWKKWF